MFQINLLPLLVWCLLIFATVGGAFADSSAPETLSVWPGLAPGETQTGIGVATTSDGVTRLTDVFTPQLLVFKPAGAKGRRPGVIVMPGGGYSILAQDLEGTEIASWLNTLGYVAIILDYRVPDNKEGAFQDGQRAISLVRSKAKELGLDPNKIGVLGFSAGGDLAVRTAVSYGMKTYPTVDAADSISSRPDFVLAVYPAYLVDANNQISSDVVPHAGMPPFFLMQTKDDHYLDAPQYAAALEAVGVQTSLLVYDTGGHGYGLRLPATEEASAWPQWAAIWLKATLGQ